MKSKLLLSPDAAAGAVVTDLNNLAREAIISRLRIAQNAIQAARRTAANITEIDEFIKTHADLIQKKIVAGITRDQAIHSIRVQLETDATEELFSITREELIALTADAEKKAAQVTAPKIAAAK